MQSNGGGDEILQEMLCVLSRAVLQVRMNGADY
jgi:hypothetical protein